MGKLAQSEEDVDFLVNLLHLDNSHGVGTVLFYSVVAFSISLDSEFTL